VNAPTRKECEAKLREAIRVSETGSILTSPKLTLHDFTQEWLEAVKHSVRPATHRRYSDIMRRHVLPIIGGVPLSKLNASHLQRLYTSRIEAGLSTTSVHHIHVTLHGAMKQALRWGMIDRNPTELLDPPRRAVPETATWNVDQTRRVLAAGNETGLAALWYLALMTGMRRGELLGLKWEDIEFEQGTLSVRRTLIRGNGGTWELGQPKTASSRRAIALPGNCLTALRQHRVRQLEQRMRLGELWQDHGFVFTGQNGQPLHPNTLAAQFERLIIAANVPRIRFHDLRHTCATLLLSQGVHPKIVQERLGHADIAMTLNRYSHVTPDMQRAAANTLDNVFGRVS
jgi:integrase